MPDGLMRKRRVTAGDVVFSQDDPADALYLIQEGRVELVQRGPDGMFETLAMQGPGQVFGEEALLLNAPRAFGARADIDCVLIAVNRGDVEIALSEADPFIRGLYEVLTQNLASVLGRGRGGATAADT